MVFCTCMLDLSLLKCTTCMKPLQVNLIRNAYTMIISSHYICNVHVMMGFTQSTFFCTFQEENLEYEILSFIKYLIVCYITITLSVKILFVEPFN